VNPSDLAPALMALDARVHLEGSAGAREIPVEELYRLPEADHRRQTVIGESELAVAVSIPMRPHPSIRCRYLKVMERATWSFALVSAAVCVHRDKKGIKQGRIVLGGVAGRPWRAYDAEKLLAGRRIDDSLARRAGEAAVSGASPLEWNAYKIPMLKNLVKRALLQSAAAPA
jgi:xanthine dehydrogenase YagS FAD-binding subunit